jgi:bidirectional [NiFe] hydrogenase diaphorase subunit
LWEEHAVTVAISPSIANGSALTEKFRRIDGELQRHQYRQDALIEILHIAQKTYGYLDEEILDYLSLQLKLPPSMVYGVATFYNFFTLQPQAEHICVVCLGTACYIKDAPAILAQIEAAFAVKPGTTTSDGRLDLLTTRCFGSCSLAPMLTIDSQVVAKLTPEAAIAAIQSKLAVVTAARQKAKA